MLLKSHSCFIVIEHEHPNDCCSFSAVLFWWWCLLTASSKIFPLDMAAESKRSQASPRAEVVLPVRENMASVWEQFGLLFLICCLLCAFWHCSSSSGDCPKSSQKQRRASSFLNRTNTRMRIWRSWKFRSLRDFLHHKLQALSYYSMWWVLLPWLSSPNIVYAWPHSIALTHFFYISSGFPKDSKCEELQTQLSQGGVHMSINPSQ